MTALCEVVAVELYVGVIVTVSVMVEIGFVVKVEVPEVIVVGGQVEV